ncbi:restriction endonuclease [Aristophania vespae]|uniref:restriction endonuclease n=1 Tax=Aristophania vespae TaxID=2697033 RepID=UPI00235193D8|nr:restriction endonuclease [Aristophania vespae]
MPPDLPLISLAFIILLKITNRFTQKRKAWRLIKQLIHYYAENLAIKRQQSLTLDSYGKVQKRLWNKECLYFCNTQILPLLKKERLSSYWPRFEKRTLHYIERQCRKYDKTSARSPVFAKALQVTTKMDPLEYERLCAELLKQNGWKAHVTPVGSDQGTDVIATRNGVMMVVQCKLYSRPVGNRAVQEIIAARAYHHAQLAAVVTNSRYTRHAHQLAASTGVHLLHHRDLQNFTEKKTLATKTLL